MSKAILGALAAAVALSAPVAAEAGQVHRKKKQYTHAYGYTGGPTPRQIANTRAYNNGQYYEQMSEAHVFGSTAWWRLKDRESTRSR